MKQLIAMTHRPSPNMEQGERTHLQRVPINHALASQQHEGYRRMLRGCGVEVRVLDVNREYPDCAFIEDTAIVLDEVAILASMGAGSRRGEPARIEPELCRYREVFRVQLPATIEGGDVLRVGRTLMVGMSARTNTAGAEALQDVAGRFGYRVVALPLRDCLHFKSACTALTGDTLLVNPDWIDSQALRGYELVAVAEREPCAANVARVGNVVCAAAAYPKTIEKLCAMGFDVRSTDLSEFAKAEGAVTCLSLLL